jgi:hypothetical protein
MRLVALVLTLGSLSVGCAMEAGDPSTDEQPQHHEEIVAVSGSARPITTTPVAAPTSTSVTPHGAVSGGGTSNTLPAAGGPATGGTIQDDNPNPSPWDPHSGTGQ